MIDIYKSLNTSAEPISYFFQKPGLGFYVPLYQRDYSWDDENIDQLMQDICSSTEMLLGDNQSILFLGTIILVKEVNPNKNIQPQDVRALPTIISNVIDGQQRISTIALLACLLHQSLSKFVNLFPSEEPFKDLELEINSKLSTLTELFSVNLQRGNPQKKPVIIRGAVDGWTLDGNDEDNYKSHVASYLAKVIRAINDKAKFPAFPDRSNLVGKNLRSMQAWIKKVENAHEHQEDAIFPSAWEILSEKSNIEEKDLWSYARPELKKKVLNQNPPANSEDKNLSSLIQVLTFTHFLLNRCCFTVIEPVNDAWAFDMFQSLNATGTPLTAIETFKPMVVNKSNNNGGFKGSNSENYFDNVDEFLGSSNTSAQKNKLTNEFITALALVVEGKKISSRFSEQRKWLNEKYNQCKSFKDCEEFTRQMSDLASYLSEILTFSPNESVAITGTENVAEKDKKIAALSILYLKDANHKMANTILSRFYSRILRKEQNSDTEFVNAVKAVSAFFTLWRSALPNTGLDEIYRNLLRNDEHSGKMSCNGDPAALTVENLKIKLKQVLNDKGVADKDSWLNKATDNLTYDKAGTVCRFALFITAHDTISDSENPGLMKIGKEGASNYLEPSFWVSKDFKTLEHIAPQKNKLPEESQWDVELYNDDEYQKIGNLTLLPVDVNSSASNKSWLEKYIYYRHLSEQDPTKLLELEETATKNGIVLKETTIDLLRQTSQKHHITPITELSSAAIWDKNFVEKRTLRICNILWDRIYPWLN